MPITEQLLPPGIKKTPMITGIFLILILLLFTCRMNLLKQSGKQFRLCKVKEIKKYTSEWKLPEYDAQVLTEEKEFADYFEAVVNYTSRL